jgi:hypothetical protein
MKCASGPEKWKRAVGFFEGISFCRGITCIRRSNKAPAKNERSKMKSKLLIVGAFVTVFTLSTFATGALLSPRAAGNQTKILTSLTLDQSVPAARTVLLSPRAAGNEIATVASKEKVAVKCPAIGSPKYLTAAGPAARTSCCGLTLADCATMDRMPK